MKQKTPNSNSRIDFLEKKYDSLKSVVDTLKSDMTTLTSLVVEIKDKIDRMAKEKIVFSIISI